MLVTAVPLTFTTDDFRSVSVPAGTEVVIFNRHLDRNALAEELLQQARHRNAAAGTPTWLVVQILGEPRLVRRIELKTPAAQPINRPVRQPSLF